MDEQRLDDFFKEHLDNFQDDGAPDAGWGKMNTVLAQYQVAEGGVFIQKRLLWAIAALILLLIGSFFFSIRNQSQQMELLSSSVESLREELDGKGRATSRMDTMILLAGPDGKLHAISPERFNELDESYISTDQSITHSSLSNKTYAYDSTHTPVFVRFSDLAKPDSIKNIAKNVNHDTIPFSGSLKDLTSKEIGKEDSVKLEKEGIAEESKKPVEKSEPRIDPSLKKLARQLGFRSGVGIFLAGGGNEYGETNPVFGGSLGLELSIGDRFSIRSGVRVSSLKYELGSLEYQIFSEDFLSRYPGIGTVDPDANLHELEMSGSFVGIPIGVRYYHPLNSKIRAFSGIDVSGGSYLSQNLKYEFIQNGREFYNRAKSSENPWTWGTGRISLGAEYGLKSNWQLEMALFFEKDLVGRGVEGYKFYLVGLSTSVWLSH